MPAGEVSLGLIGVGRWGRNILHTLATLPGVKLAAVASTNPETEKLVPSGCRIHADWRQVVTAGDIDGVIVATPPAMHAQILVAGAEAKKAVMVEKPLVESRAAAHWLREQIGGRRFTVLVDHIHLFHPAFQELQRQAVTLGPVRSIASSAGKMRDADKDASLLWDWAPHDLAMCMALVPGPVQVMGAEYLESGSRGETISFSLALSGNAEARVELSSLKPRHRWFAAMFDDCVLVYRDLEPGSLTRLHPGQDVQAPGSLISFEEERPLRAAIAQFVDAIRRNDQGRGSFELGLSVVDLIADIEDRLARPDH